MRSTKPVQAEAAVFALRPRERASCRTVVGAPEANLYACVGGEPIGSIDPLGRGRIAIGGGGSGDSLVATIRSLVSGWPGASGVGASSGMFVDSSASRGISIGVYDSFSGRFGLSAPAPVAGGVTLAVFTDLDKFRGKSVVKKAKTLKFGVGFAAGVASASVGPGTPQSFFLGVEFASTDLLSWTFRPWGFGDGCRPVF